MYLKGIYKKNIFQSTDGYVIGLMKVKDNDIDSLLNDKTITFTGYFSNINLEDNLLVNGKFVVHNKYGEQFSVDSYEVIMPDNENGIVTFLSSDLFKGIGESKAQKIYDHLGDDAINIILEDKDRLLEIKGITKKNVEVIYNTLVEYEDSVETIVKLNELGFNSKDSNSLYHKYKNRILRMIDEDIYQIINEDTNFTFKKVDSIALKLNYNNDDDRRIKSGIIYVINEVINTIGDTYLSSEEIYNYLNRALLIMVDTDKFNTCLTGLIREEKVIRTENRFYLKKMYDAENNIAKRLVYLNNKKDNNYKNLDQILEKTSQKHNILYNEEQLSAIKNAFIKNFLIITGGPGTGKTTIIKSIVDVYQDLNKLSKEALIKDIVLLAPTGRASKRIMESVHLPSQTIHRFLKWNKETNKFAVNEFSKSNAKLVIIDEASMIDTYLLDSLLKGLRYDTKIILVGDYNQLPSVGSGQVLKDLIESDMFSVIKLNKLYRQSENSNIITFAYDINNGDFNNEIFNQSDDLTLIECDSYNLMYKFSELCYAYKDYDYNDLIILAPMYKTINGIDNLNLVAREIFNPKDNKKKEIQIGETKYRENDKIIELVNMPDANVYNGDIGIIIEIDNNKKEVYVDYDGNIVKYTKSTFSNFKLGYVISIHKSQGSEFKIVIMTILNEYGRMLYRKLLYTGVTRAKKNLFILGEDNAIKRAIKNNAIIDRKTTLKLMVLNMYEEKSIN